MYVKIGNPAFWIALYITAVHFRSELQHVGHAGGQKIKYQPIRTREIGGVRLQEELKVERSKWFYCYASRFYKHFFKYV